MKKIKPTDQKMKDLADLIGSEDTFHLYPGNALPDLSRDILPLELSKQLDSMTCGISGNNLFLCFSRIDSKDDPDLINNDVFICDYNFSTKTIAPTGWYIYRYGEGWHHVEPSVSVSDSQTFDTLGIEKSSKIISGYNLSSTLKKLVDDTYNVKKDAN